MLVTSHAYAIDIVTAAEDAHQDAHNQVAAVMIDQRESIVVSPFVLGPWYDRTLLSLSSV